MWEDHLQVYTDESNPNKILIKINRRERKQFPYSISVFTTDTSLWTVWWEKEKHNCSVISADLAAALTAMDIRKVEDRLDIITELRVFLHKIYLTGCQGEFKSS